MVKPSNNDNGVAPFLKKCYQMVDDNSTDSIISWGHNNDSFVISDITEFSVRLLPKYFKHNNFSSFIRQLNIYGFRKTDTDRWEFSNEGFIRDQKHLLKSINRRKGPQGSEQKKIPQPEDNMVESSGKTENQGLWKEVEVLKADKNALMQELVKLRQHLETSENKIVVLGEQLQGMEKNQQQMLSFLVMAMQNPAILAQFLHPKENTWQLAESSKIMLEDDTDVGKTIVPQGTIVRYQPPVNVTSDSAVSPISGSEKPAESDPFPDGFADFSVNTDFLKHFMEEKLCASENPAPLILPDIPDDGIWEQLLLASPFLENIEDSSPINEEPAEDDMETDQCPESSQSFRYLVEQMEKSQNYGKESSLHYLNKIQNMEFLTEQTEILAAEIKQ